MPNTTNESRLLAAVKELSPWISGLRNEDIAETFRDKIEKVLAVVEEEAVATKNEYSCLPPECTYVDAHGDGYAPVKIKGEVRYDCWIRGTQSYLYLGGGNWTQAEMDRHCTYIGERNDYQK